MQPLWLATYHWAVILFVKAMIEVLSTATIKKKTQKDSYSDFDLMRKKKKISSSVYVKARQHDPFRAWDAFWECYCLLLELPFTLYMT